MSCCVVEEISSKAVMGCLLELSRASTTVWKLSMVCERKRDVNFSMDTDPL